MGGHLMFARVILWSFAVILIETGTVEPAKALAERAKPTEKATLVTLTTVVTQKLEQPVYLTHAGDGSSRLFAVEQPGRIRILQEQTMLPEAFLDITGRVLSGGERGLLGLAFHPDYRRNGRFFVNYTREPDGATVIAEYHRGATSTLASPEERILLTVPQPYPNHNGGMMSFGPGGYLYIGLGDGGSAGDPENRAQNPEELLGKILRIDIDEVTRMGFLLIIHSPKEVAVQKSMLLDCGTPGAFHLTVKPGSCGSLMSDNISGKKSTSSPVVGTMAGERWKGRIVLIHPTLAKRPTSIYHSPNIHMKRDAVQSLEAMPTAG
ncbi:MAG: PQQ-dependent sugar dehydrogenase [Nitrospira sp.]|nr:PQQ-dependent sugar dehydrogenase [Nitrospira sp.]